MYRQACYRASPGMLPCIARHATVCCQACCRVSPGMLPCIARQACYRASPGRHATLYRQACYPVSPGMLPCVASQACYRVLPVRHATVYRQACYRVWHLSNSGGPSAQCHLHNDISTMMPSPQCHPAGASGSLGFYSCGRRHSRGWGGHVCATDPYPE
jgi:hypothetical protein